MTKHDDQEREAFEAAYLKAYYPGVHCGKLTAPHVFTRVEYPGFQVQHKGDYERSDVQRGWVMWQARAAVQPAGVAVPESWRDVIYNTLRNYRMSTLDDGEGGGYPLIDAMTADGQTVAGGIEECEYLADALVDALAAAPHPVSGERKADDWLSLAHEVEALGSRYWKAAVRERGPGAVQWLRNEETGAMFIFTRGEYARELQEFCSTLPLSQAVQAVKPAAQDVAGLVEALNVATGRWASLAADSRFSEAEHRREQPELNKALAVLDAHRAQQGGQPS